MSELVKDSEEVIRYNGQRVNCCDVEHFIMALKANIMDIQKIERILKLAPTGAYDNVSYIDPDSIPTGEGASIFKMTLDNGDYSLWNIGE